MKPARPAPKVWVLNLDAEQELGTRGSYTPSAAMGKIVAAQRAPLLGSLVAPGDFVLLDANEPGDGAGDFVARDANEPKGCAGDFVARSANERGDHPGDSVLRDASKSGDRAGRFEMLETNEPELSAGGKRLRAIQLDPDLDVAGAVGLAADLASTASSAPALAKHLLPVGDMSVLRGLTGAAWSPTPSALAKLKLAGALASDAPAIGTLRTVNARGFAADLRSGLELELGALTKHVIPSVEEAKATLHAPAALGWLVRRPFGAAGRGRMRIESLSTHDLTRAEESWLVASLSLGPIVVEPWVEITQEFTRSAWLGTDGSISISAPCFQGTTVAGAWDGSRRLVSAEVSRSDDQALAQALEATGASLHQAGYHGPFGIDAFRHRSGPGKTVLNPLSEINARFTMDWTCAMGKRSHDFAAPGASTP